MRIRFNCLRIECLSTILCMASALVPISLAGQTVDRFWWDGQINGKPARLALDTGCDFDIVLWRGTAERLGLKLKDSGKQICPWVSDPFKIELPLYERRWGFPVAMVDRIRAPVCEAPSLANEDGLVGWPVISRRITRFDAVHSRFEFLRNVPREVQNWAKFTIRTNEHVLVLEGFNSDGAGGGLFIDTGDADGSVGLSADLWDQWVAAHPQGRRGIWANLGVECLTPCERTWTSQFPIGNLPLTNAVLDRVENAWFSKKLIVEIGFVVLKQFDLVVDGQHAVAYLKRSKEWKNSMAEPPDQTFLDGCGGVVFGPWRNQTNSLIAHVMVGANPAFETGIRDGDVLLKVDQKDVMQWLDNPGKNWLFACRAYGFQNVKASTNSPTGTKVELTLRRRDQVFQASVLQSEIAVIAPRKTK